MAPKVQVEFKEHGWWITGEDALKPNLWISEFRVLPGRHWSALGRVVGVLQSITSSPNGFFFMHVEGDEPTPTKYRLQKKLIMAPVPLSLIGRIPPMKMLRGLEREWDGLPEQLRTL